MGDEHRQGAGVAFVNFWGDRLRVTVRKVAFRPLAMLRLAGGALLSVAVCGPAVAQMVPSAGSILRDVERSVPMPSPPPAIPTRPAEEAEPQFLKEGQTVLVKGFDIQSSLFPPATLAELVKDYVGRECSLGDLQEAAAKIGRYYREHDYLAKAILPKQNIHDGIVKIVVVEGRLGSISVDPAASSRLDPDIAVGRMAWMQNQDGAIHPSAVQAGIAHIDAVPGALAKATLVPGRDEGQTDVVLRLQDTPLVSGSGQIDNGSARSVGSLRGIGSLSLNDPMGQGDLENLILLRSNGSRYGRLAGTLPVGYSGLTVGVNASYLDFAVDKEYSRSDSDGSAATGGLTASYPLLTRDDLVLNLTAGFDHKRLMNETAHLTTSDNQIEVGNVGIGGSAKDGLGGVTTASLGGAFGRLLLGRDADNRASDQGTAQTEGNYGKLTASAVRSQMIADKTEMMVSLSGQYGFKNLDSTEKFSLGGSQGVRAYPVSEAEGDSGWLGQLEFRQKLTEDFKAGPFIDAGHIIQHKSTWSGWSTGGQPNQYSLYGVGLDTAWTLSGDILLKGTLAHRLGNNPGRSAGGYDSDGLHETTRLWVQAVAQF